jgi:hypothetical protein
MSRVLINRFDRHATPEGKRESEGEGDGKKGRTVVENGGS